MSAQIPEPVTVTVGTQDYLVPAGPIPDDLPGDVRFHLQAIADAVSPAAKKPKTAPTSDAPKE
jgi:hypothetical protein